MIFSHYKFFIYLAVSFLWNSPNLLAAAQKTLKASAKQLAADAKGKNAQLKNDLKKMYDMIRAESSELDAFTKEVEQRYHFKTAHIASDESPLSDLHALYFVASNPDQSLFVKFTMLHVIKKRHPELTSSSQSGSSSSSPTTSSSSAAPTWNAMAAGNSAAAQAGAPSSAAAANSSTAATTTTSSSSSLKSDTADQSVELLNKLIQAQDEMSTLMRERLDRMAIVKKEDNELFTPYRELLAKSDSGNASKEELEKLSELQVRMRKWAADKKVAESAQAESSPAAAELLKETHARRARFSKISAESGLSGLAIAAKQSMHRELITLRPKR